MEKPSGYVGYKLGSRGTKRGYDIIPQWVDVGKILVLLNMIGVIGCCQVDK
jgi:hypothetical protein